MPKNYCVSYGCLNSATARPSLSFFKLPADIERRTKWLNLICREDLLDRPPRNYTICEDHFHAKDILVGKQRKKLKQNALPALRLPKLQKNGVPSIPAVPTYVEAFAQTDPVVTIIVCASTQTPSSFPEDSPRKRKLRDDDLESKKGSLLNDIDNETESYQRDVFHKLCDKFLTKDLAETVKEQTVIMIDD